MFQELQLKKLFDSCAASGIPIIRIMFTGQDSQRNYFDRDSQMKREIEGILPYCEKYKVKLAIQPHYGAGINNSMELLHLIDDYPSDYGRGHLGFCT